MPGLGSPLGLPKPGKILLHDECQEGSARSINVVLDLSGVSYADREGVEMLRAVLGPHVRIAAAPCDMAKDVPVPRYRDFRRISPVIISSFVVLTKQTTLITIAS